MRLGSTVVSAAVAAVIASAAAASSAAAAPPIGLQYSVQNLPANTALNILYQTGVNGAAGGDAQTSAGALSFVDFGDNDLILSASDQATSLTALEYLNVGSAPITGTANVPTGTTVTVTNLGTGNTITLNNGQFSIPTENSLSPRAHSKTLTVPCASHGSSCVAKVSIAHRARNRHVTIRLPRHGLRLASIRPHPRPSRDIYSVTRGHYSKHDTQYQFTLNTAGSNPRHAHLNLTFRAPN